MEINEQELNKKLEGFIEKIKCSVDDKANSFNKGYQSAKEHNTPSPETNDFIIKTEKTMATFAEDIGTIKDKLAEVPTKTEMELVVTRAVMEAIKSCDNKYASKMTEKIVNGAVVFILTAFMGSIVYMVIR